MVLFSPDWTNIGFFFILLTVNLFRHSTLIEHGLYLMLLLCLYPVVNKELELENAARWYFCQAHFKFFVLKPK